MEPDLSRYVQYHCINGLRQSEALASAPVSLYSQTLEMLAVCCWDSIFFFATVFVVLWLARFPRSGQSPLIPVWGSVVEVSLRKEHWPGRGQGAPEGGVICLKYLPL